MDLKTQPPRHDFPAGTIVLVYNSKSTWLPAAAHQNRPQATRNVLKNKRAPMATAAPPLIRTNCPSDASCGQVAGSVARNSKRS